MGFAKYKEDILRQKTDAEYYRQIVKYTVKSVEPPIFTCSYCNAAFNSKNELYAHIKHDHSITNVILVVNGKIVNKECYVNELHSLLVVRYNLHDKVSINSIQVDLRDDCNEFNLTEQVNKELTNHNSVVISIGDKTYAIHLISKEHINVEIINSIVSQWSMETSQGKYIQKATAQFNELELKCLDGLYNYFLACNASGRDKESRYNDAYAILLEVANVLPVGAFILKIIAFKYNWIEQLRSLCINNDIFTTVCDFLTNKETTAEHNLDGTMQIFIEDELAEIIRIIQLYQSKDYHAVLNSISKYNHRSVLDIEDSNLRDKICLLCARMSVKESSTHEARRYYNEIQSPFFDAEKNQFVRSL